MVYKKRSSTSSLSYIEIWGAADEAVLNKVHKKFLQIPLFNVSGLRRWWRILFYF